MKLSVIVPCYNQGRFLPDCVISLVGGETPLCKELGLTDGQTFRDFEVLIVDDASTDDTWMMGVMLSGPRNEVPVSCYQLKENVGTPGALNAGISQAQGEWVTVVQGDDLVEPWHLMQLLRFAGKRRFVYGDLRLLVDNQRDRVLEMATWDFEKAKRRNLAHGILLFHREAWEQVGGYPGAMNEGREDWAMTLRLAAHGIDGYHIQGQKPGYLYRRHGDNRSSRNHTPEWTAKFERQIREVLPEVYGGEIASSLHSSQ